MMDLIELRNLDNKGLEKEIEKAGNELIKLVMGVRTNQKKENHMLSFLRKYIARAFTLLGEKKTLARKK